MAPTPPASADDGAESGPIPIQTMEARSEPELPVGDGWWFEPKWDGFRCLAQKANGAVVLQARSGKPLTRFFPEVVERLRQVKAARFIVDGELLAPAGGLFAFSVLQMRLHPAASRIARLAREQPAILMLFDLLLDPDARDWRPEPFERRRMALEAFVGRHGDERLRLSPGSRDREAALAWLADGTVEGVVAKRLDEPYRAGERAMVKVKRARTADCVVGGFRYGADGGIGSLLLGLYDDEGRLNHVGFTSGMASVDRAALTRTLLALRGGAGFTGAAPGGPSRWSTERSAAWEPVRPELVVEVAFDHVTDGRFRHGTRLLRLRPDKGPRQCTLDQIAP
jgi:ATP-dependent DNA ligase